MIRDVIDNINNLCNKYQSEYEIFILYIEIKKILEQLNNNILDELLKYNFIDIININGYTKYIIYSSDIFDMILIKWNKNKESKIHDHPERGCVMKILSGKLCEETYDSNIKLLDKQILNVNNIGYRISNKILHKIIALHDTYSLHVYIPGKYKPKYYN
jgi:hypothetical protein